MENWLPFNREFSRRGCLTAIGQATEILTIWQIAGRHPLPICRRLGGMIRSTLMQHSFYLLIAEPPVYLHNVCVCLRMTQYILHSVNRTNSVHSRFQEEKRIAGEPTFLAYLSVELAQRLSLFHPGIQNTLPPKKLGWEISERRSRRLPQFRLTILPCQVFTDVALPVDNEKFSDN